MGQSTFSGPLKVGNKDAGAGTVPVVAVLDFGNMAGRTVGNTDTLMARLPAGQIIDVWVDQTVASVTGTTTISVGTTAGGADLFTATATTAGGRFRNTLTAALLTAWQLAAEVPVYVRNATGTATLTAGRAIVCVEYLPR